MQSQCHLESSVVRYVVFLDTFPFTQYFALIREVLMGLSDLCFSFDFILESRDIMSLVALNADCLSAVRAHAHSEWCRSNFIVCVLFFLRFGLFSLLVARLQTHHTLLLKAKEKSDKTRCVTNTVTSGPSGRMKRLSWGLMLPISMSSKFAKLVLPIPLSKCRVFPSIVLFFIFPCGPEWCCWLSGFGLKTSRSHRDHQGREIAGKCASTIIASGCSTETDWREQTALFTFRNAVREWWDWDVPGEHWHGDGRDPTMSVHREIKLQLPNLRSVKLARTFRRFQRRQRLQEIVGFWWCPFWWRDRKTEVLNCCTAGSSSSAWQFVPQRRGAACDRGRREWQTSLQRARPIGCVWGSGRIMEVISIRDCVDDSEGGMSLLRRTILVDLCVDFSSQEETREWHTTLLVPFVAQTISDRTCHEAVRLWACSCFCILFSQGLHSRRRHFRQKEWQSDNCGTRLFWSYSMCR